MSKAHSFSPKYSAFVPHLRVTCDPVGDSRTRQEFADECDINNIMRRYEKAGVVTHFSPRQPKYMDLSNLPDFQNSMNMMIEAKASFMSLPARVRKEFDNDPAKFVEFASNSENIDKLREWGLAEPVKAPDAPMRVEVVNQPAELDELPDDAPKAAGGRSKPKAPTQ